MECLHLAQRMGSSVNSLWRAWASEVHCLLAPDLLLDGLGLRPPFGGLLGCLPVDDLLVCLFFWIKLLTSIFSWPFLHTSRGELPLLLLINVVVRPLLKHQDSYVISHLVL